MQLAQNVVVAGRFRLNRLLGRGGMGSVWHATHLGLDTPCAVKFIEGEFANHPEAQTRFEREAKAAASLRSPNVVQIFDHGVWESTPYIAMELLDGEDLGKRIQKAGRLSPPEVSRIISEVCRALTKAHAAGVVHRDLKPDNIFLVPDEEREIAKVLDFGIAKASNVTALDGATKTGAVLGTPYYMSPEQARGAKSLDFKTDLWALAVIVFQCLTGKLPFEGEALGELFMKIMVEPIPVPSQIVPDLPPNFDAWWARASSRDPAARFANAREFSDSLALVLGVSQLTDMMDRNQVRAAMQSMPFANTGNTGNVPYAPTGVGGTGQHAAMSGSQPNLGGAGTSNPALQNPHGATAAGMSRTYDDGVATPKKGPGALVAALGGALIVLIGVVGVLVVRKPDAPEASPAAAAVAPPPVVAPPVVPPVVTPVAAPTTVEVAHAAPSASASAHAVTVAAPSKNDTKADERRDTHHSSRGSRGDRDAKPAATGTKPPSNDLGF